MAVIGDSANCASIGLHKSLGFREVGVLRSVGFKFDRWVAMLDTNLPSGDEVRSNLATAGFSPTYHEIVTEIVAPDWPSFVRKSALRADSFLARLPDSEFDQGMAALRAHRANINPAAAVTEEIDWFVFTKPA